MRALLVASLVIILLAGPAASIGAGLLPDLQTVVPLHLQIQNAQHREILRFSNGIANTGAGDWRLRPEFPVAGEEQVQRAIQEILDAERNVAEERVASVFEFHPTHNHWHIGAVAIFEVRPALDDGTGGAWGAPFVNDRGESQSFKTTFCLIDWYKLQGNSPSKERIYFDCAGTHQGIQPGWVDQYHQATDGQQVDITSAPEGVYYLVSRANPDGLFAETDLANNEAWRSFRVVRASNGNPSLELVARSPCATAALCGEGAPNR